VFHIEKATIHFPFFAAVGGMSQVSERIHADEYQAGRMLEQLVRLHKVYTTPGRQTTQY
jgi:hypothetical protein